MYWITDPKKQDYILTTGHELDPFYVPPWTCSARVFCSVLPVTIKIILP